VKIVRSISIEAGVWEMAREHARKRDESFSALVEQCLKEALGLYPAGMTTSYAVDLDSGTVNTSATFLTATSPTLPEGVTRGFGSSKAAPKPGTKK